ncbi:hypothetical protein [Pseudophaeobacter leonis]|uniref:hypothetical protein n=1 Tax=Pseudophaeobacter leonis TaxID=1144477 RepID=UPI00137484B0|nr:hypothetical protein [Pseudophaeobacter leonis]
MLASYRIPAARIRADLTRHHHKAAAGLHFCGIFVALRNSAVLHLREAFFITKT